MATLGATEISVRQSDGAVLIPVALSAPVADTTFVKWTATRGTATRPAHYSEPFGSLIFSKGDSAKNISISIVTHPELTAPRTFSVKLDPGSGYDIATPFVCTITILPNNVPAEISPPKVQLQTRVRSAGRRVQVTATAIDGIGQRTIKRQVVRLPARGAK